MKKEFVPNKVYKFRLSLKIDTYPFELTIPTKVVGEDLYGEIDEFDNDENEVKKAYFTPEVIEHYRNEVIDMIKKMKNPFDIFCADKDSDWNFTEDDLFRKK